MVTNFHQGKESGGIKCRYAIDMQFAKQKYSIMEKELNSGRSV